MSATLYERTLEKPESSFFLFGPRGVGKTTWLKRHLGDSIRFDLLSSRDFLELSRDPSILEAKIGNRPKETWVLIDEIQKLPGLLDEVHRLIEEKQFRFALSGSSARKLKRTGANLLAGRAVTRNLFPLTSFEMSGDFNLDRVLEWGGLPLSIQSKDPADFLQAYFFTYLKEEIQEEGLVRQIDPFVRFLEVAAILNGQVLNVENISRETATRRVTLDKWFTILIDTLFGFMLPGWRPKIKVRETAHPKFYWFDPGVARAAAGLLDDKVDSTWLGRSFETCLLHELRCYNNYSRKNRPFYYYLLPSGREIDVIIETKKAQTHSVPDVICLEFKTSNRWNRQWENSIRELKENKKVKVKRMIGVYRGKEELIFDNFEVLPVNRFLFELHLGKIF